MRFKVVEGSESKHCCFDATVVDTTKPWSADRYEPVCECFELTDAEMIAAALNMTDDPLREARGVLMGALIGALAWVGILWLLR